MQREQLASNKAKAFTLHPFKNSHCCCLVERTAAVVKYKQNKTLVIWLNFYSLRNKHHQCMYKWSNVKFITHCYSANRYCTHTKINYCGYLCIAVYPHFLDFFSNHACKSRVYIPMRLRDPHFDSTRIAEFLKGLQRKIAKENCKGLQRQFSKGKKNWPPTYTVVCTTRVITRRFEMIVSSQLIVSVELQTAVIKQDDKL